MKRSITLEDAIEKIKNGAYLVECASPSKGKYYLIQDFNGFYKLRTNSGYKIQYETFKDNLEYVSRKSCEASMYYQYCK